jgi:hypothetical protein
MAEVSSIAEGASKRVPWNKGMVVGAKPPLRHHDLQSYQLDRLNH